MKMSSFKKTVKLIVFIILMLGLAVYTGAAVHAIAFDHNSLLNPGSLVCRLRWPAFLALVWTGIYLKVEIWGKYIGKLYGDEEKRK